MVAPTRVDGIPNELKEIGLLKFELLASGLRVTEIAKQALRRAKGPIRTRSGASGGLDLILPGGIHVNAPVNETFAADSILQLGYDQGELALFRGEQKLVQVALQPIPRYYDSLTTDGVPMVRIGQMCSGDRFCYGMTGAFCFFWREDRRCGFCTTGLNGDQDAAQKTARQLLETLDLAVTDPSLPAKHILIGGGTPEGEDMGAKLASQLCYAIKSRFNISCYVMICAPLKNDYIQMLRDSGADELGLNLELYSDQAWKELIPGKNQYIGRERYLSALEFAVSVFGPINTRSLLIVGLEDPEYTIAGAERLASMGVMPILSPFRPLKGSKLEARRGFSHEVYWETYAEVHARAASYDIPTGPTCIACQNNVLALPLPDERYRFY